MDGSNGPSFLQAVYQAEWKNPEAKAANISLGVAVTTFGVGIAFLRAFGDAIVPAI